jgi:hypothetical protein
MANMKRHLRPKRDVIPPAITAAAGVPEPPVITPAIDVFAMAIGGGQQLLAQSSAWRVFLARLDTYRRLYPDRWAHVVAFTDGIDDPTPDQVAAMIAQGEERARAKAAAP